MLIIWHESGGQGEIDQHRPVKRMKTGDFALNSKNTWYATPEEVITIP